MALNMLISVFYCFYLSLSHFAVKNNDFNSDHDIWKFPKFNYWFHLVDYYLCGKFLEERWIQFLRYQRFLSGTRNPKDFRAFVENFHLVKLCLWSFWQMQSPFFILYWKVLSFCSVPFPTGDRNAFTERIDHC